MNHHEYGSVEDYARAFSLIHDEIPEKHAALLQAHASAPDRTASWRELAEEVGYSNAAAVNLQYGKLARRVAEALGITAPPRGFWLHVLADWAGEPDSKGHTRFVLRTPVVDAAARLGLVSLELPKCRVAASRASPPTVVSAPGQETIRPGLLVAGVCERDIDLLLLEEFMASREFVRWFAERVGISDGEVVLASARRSVTESIGESDLEISVDLSTGQSYRLLIENKIGAAFQSRQSERYRERGETYKGRGECDSYITVLVAPEIYLGGSGLKGFDKVVSYEMIQDWFAGQKTLGRRSQYKQLILDQAIQKAVHGYQLVADAPVTDFWRSYWDVARAIAPNLEMTEPIGKPAGAGFIYFRPPALPKSVAIVHKLRHGYLDLQFAGMGKQLSTLRARYGYLLLSSMTIAQAEGSGVIRQKMPKFRTNEPFEPQRGDAEVVLKAANDLLRWFEKADTSESRGEV